MLAPTERLPFVEQGWIDVVNYVPNEKSNVAGKRAGQQPIVLARLPRVGDVPGAPSGPAAHETVPAPEVMPQLDLRTEIQQRSRLQIAENPADSQSAAASHFVDRQHSVAPDDRQDFVAPDDRQDFVAPDRTERLVSPPHPRLHGQAATQVQQHRRSSSPPSAAGRPRSVVAKLFQLHAQLAPYAGLIVTLALIASAGLLYWMIVGPTHAPAPNYESPSYEMQPEGFGATSDYCPEFAADSKPVAEVATLPKAWSQVPLSAPPQEQPAPGMLAPPKKKASTPSQASSASELRFPETSHPQKLDFTAAVPKRLPVVAQFPTASSRR